MATADPSHFRGSLSMHAGGKVLGGKAHHCRMRPLLLATAGQLLIVIDTIGCSLRLASAPAAKGAA